MSLLGKYKNKDGFFQLVRLLELSDPEKQKSLIRLVGGEDPGWARLAQIKMLSKEKILSWPAELLTQILQPLDQAVVSALLFPQTNSVNAHLKDNVKRAVTSRTFREINANLEKRSYDDQEQFAASVKLIQTVREMQHLGLIDFGQVDENLVIDEKLVA